MSNSNSNEAYLTVTGEDGLTVETYSRGEVESFWNEWKTDPATATDRVPATLIGLFSDPRISGTDNSA